MTKSKTIKIYEEIVHLINNPEKYSNVTAEIYRIAADDLQNFIRSVMEESDPELPDSANKWREFPSTVMHKAAMKGNIEIMAAILNIYRKHVFLCDSTPKNLPKSSKFANSLLYKEINGLKAKSLLMNKILNLKNNNGDTVIHWAIECRRLNTVKWLVENGADLTITNKYRQTPLHLASIVEINEIFPFLLNITYEEIKLKLRDTWDNTILTSISGYAKPELIERLLELGADPNSRNGYGDNSLNRFAIFGSLESVKILLKYGAQLNCLDRNGNDALVEATRHGELEIVEILLKHGRENNIRILTVEKSIKSAKKSYEYTRSRKFIEIVELLEATLKSYEIEDAKSIESAPPTHVASASPKTAFRG